MTVVAFKDRDGTAAFTCIDCGKPVVSTCHRDDRPICALCRHLPGWRRNDQGRLIPPPDADG